MLWANTRSILITDDPHALLPSYRLCGSFSSSAARIIENGVRDPPRPSLHGAPGLSPPDTWKLSRLLTMPNDSLNFTHYIYIVEEFLLKIVYTTKHSLIFLLTSFFFIICSWWRVSATLLVGHQTATATVSHYNLEIFINRPRHVTLTANTPLAAQVSAVLQMLHMCYTHTRGFNFFF